MTTRPRILQPWDVPNSPKQTHTSHMLENPWTARGSLRPQRSGFLLLVPSHQNTYWSTLAQQNRHVCAVKLARVAVTAPGHSVKIARLVRQCAYMQRNVDDAGQARGEYPVSEPRHITDDWRIQQKAEHRDDRQAERGTSRNAVLGQTARRFCHLTDTDSLLPIVAEFLLSGVYELHLTILQRTNSSCCRPPASTDQPDAAPASTYRDEADCQLVCADHDRLSCPRP